MEGIVVIITPNTVQLVRIEEYFQRDITTQQAVAPLVHLAGIGIPNLQQRAIKALESVSVSWPNAVVDVGGIIELSKFL